MSESIDIGKCETCVHRGWAQPRDQLFSMPAPPYFCNNPAVVSEFGENTPFDVAKFQPPCGPDELLYEERPPAPPLPELDDLKSTALEKIAIAAIFTTIFLLAFLFFGT